MPPHRSNAQVRRAGSNDAPALARLLEAFQREYDEPSPSIETLTRRYRDLLAAGEMVVLVAGQGPDGFAQLRFRPWVYSDRLCAYLEELYVSPPLRGDGMGRTLLEAAMDAAREEGAEHIELNTAEDDRAARGLYESTGFTNREGGPDGPVMLYYEREL